MTAHGKIDPAIARALITQDLASFIIRTYATVDASSPFLPNWHIRLLADYLIRASRREIKRLVITLPPRSLKSIAASVALPAWMLGHNPALRIICASYSQDLAGKHARDCRTVMQSSWYRAAFPNAALNPAKLAEHEFETMASGYRLSTSVGGTLTGRGGNFIIIDDPIKPMDAHSDTNRTAVKRWFDGTLLSRLDSKRDDVVILIMQRVHVDDLVAHVLEQVGWTHLQLPAIAVSDETFVLQAEGPFKGVKVGRKAGEVLHPAREPMDVLNRVKAEIGSFVFTSQYQQMPVPPGGNILRQEWFKETPAGWAPKPDARVIQSWDVAMTANDGSDWSVCTTWVDDGGDYHLIDAYRVRLSFPAVKKAVASRQLQFGAQTVLIEDVGIGTGLIQQLRSEGDVRPIGIAPQGSKTDRMVAQSSKIEAGRVHLPRSAPWRQEFMAEMMAFPHGRHDDQVDSVSQYLGWISKRAGIPRIRSLF